MDNITIKNLKTVRELVTTSLIGLFLFCIPLLATSQENEASKEMEQTGTTLRQGSESTFKIISYNKKGAVTFSESGTIAMQGNKYSVSLNNGVRSISDGKSQWIYNPQNNEIIIGERSDIGTPTDNPFIIFSNPSEHYKISYGKKRNSSYEIILSPKKDKRYSKIIIVFGINRMPEEIKIEVSNGNRYNIKINSVKKKTNFPNEKFILNINDFKGATVTDLR